MKREEAIAILDRRTTIPGDGYSFDDINEAIDMAIEALRPITREQVEKAWQGEWIPYLDGEHIMPERYYRCSKCGNRGHRSKRNFCPACGAPMTDKAVDILWHRLEAMQDADD